MFRMNLHVTSVKASVLLLALAVMLTVTGPAQTFSVIHNFTGAGDGANPYAGLTTGQAGALYGTAGVVFKLRDSGSGWTLTPLYNLGAIGNELTIDSNGVLYGTTPESGLGEGLCWEFGCGRVFSLQPQPSVCKSFLCNWNKNKEYDFTGGSDGYYPNGGLVLDGAGNVYGTEAGSDTLFELSPSGSGWTLTTIYQFASIDGYEPLSGVIFDHAGNMYGTTAWGGANDKGMVYELTRSGSSWTGTVLYSFRNQEDGRFVVGGLIFDQAGNLYGTTAEGGAENGGTVFELSPSNGGWTYTLLYSLSGSSNGGGPQAALAMDASGNLYGTTSMDGAYGQGSVFKLTPGEGGWTYTSLHDFTGGNDGSMWYSTGGPVLDSNGNVYGTAPYGGSNGPGVVWEITP
jgi:uncharacterized repeat protein (TIGR03803 family)